MNIHVPLPGERPAPTPLDMLKAVKRAAHRQLSANWHHRHDQGVRRWLVLRAVARLRALKMTPEQLQAALDTEPVDPVRTPALTYVLALKQAARAAQKDPRP